MNSAKNKFHKLLIYLPSAMAVLLFLILLFPQQAHAAPLYEVLKSDQSIKGIWKSVKDMVNYLVVAVLIFVAFAQILHININTYGVKKILPALVLAVIGANLSYFVCRILVDVANIVLTLFVQPQTGSLSGALKLINETEFRRLVQPAGKSADFFVLFVKILMELVGAVMIFILAFLLFIRNWMIYFLVVLGPLAFMATAIPQGKSIFTQWWSQFLKWTFMPIVSIFWLWLGAKWSGALVNSVSSTGDADTSGWLLKCVFAMACFYLAITTPLKMGGPIMQQWSNLGKKAWGKTGGVLTKNFGTALGNQARAQWLHQTTKAKEFMWNKPVLGKLVGGLERSEMNLKDAERYSAGLKERIQGGHIAKKGTKRQMFIEKLKTMEGEIPYAESMAIEEIIEAGRNDPNNPNYKKLLQYQAGSGKAGLRMAAVEKAYQARKDETLQKILSEEFMKEGNLEIGGRNYTLEERKKEFGIHSVKEWRKLIDEHSASNIEAIEADAQLKKRLDKLLADPMRVRMNIHNVAEFKKVAEDMARDFREHGQEFERLLTLDRNARRDAMQQLGYDEAMIKRFDNYTKNRSKLEKILLDSGALRKGQSVADRDGAIIYEANAKYQENYRAKMKQIQLQNVDQEGNLDIWLRDLVQMDNNGQVQGLNMMDKMLATRARVIHSKDIMEKQNEWLEEYGPLQLINALREGRLETEGLDERHFQAALTGKVDAELEPPDIRKALAIINAVKKISISGNAAVRTPALDALMSRLQEVGNYGTIVDSALDVVEKVGEYADPSRKEFEPFRRAFEKLKNASGVQDFDPRNRAKVRELVNGLNLQHNAEHQRIARDLAEGIIHAANNAVALQTTNKLAGASTPPTTRGGDANVG